MSETRGGISGYTQIGMKADGTPITMPMGHFLPAGNEVETITLSEAVTLTFSLASLVPRSINQAASPNGSYPTGAALTVWSFVAAALQTAGVVA